MLKHLVSQMQPFACVGALFRFFVQPSLVFLFPAASLNDVPSPCNGPPSPTVDFVPQANSAIYFWFVVLIVLATGGTAAYSWHRSPGSKRLCRRPPPSPPPPPPPQPDITPSWNGNENDGNENDGNDDGDGGDPDNNDEAQQEQPTTELCRIAQAPDPEDPPPPAGPVQEDDWPYTIPEHDAFNWLLALLALNVLTTFLAKRKQATTKSTQAVPMRFSTIDIAPIIPQHATKAAMDLVDIPFGPTVSLSSTPAKHRLRLRKLTTGLIFAPGFIFIAGTLWLLGHGQILRNPLPPPPPPPPLLLPQQGRRSDVITRLAQDLAAKRTALAQTAASRGIQLPPPPPVKCLRAELAYAIAMRKTRVWLETQQRRVHEIRQAWLQS